MHGARVLLEWIHICNFNKHVKKFTLQSLSYKPSVIQVMGWGWFSIKIPCFRHKKFHCGDKTILRPPYLHNEISHPGGMASSYITRGMGYWTPFVNFSVSNVFDLAKVPVTFFDNRTDIAEFFTNVLVHCGTVIWWSWQNEIRLLQRSLMRVKFHIAKNTYSSYSSLISDSMNCRHYTFSHITDSGCL